MRFSHIATLRIVPPSPCPPSGESGWDLYNSDLIFPCQANATSGTFDPDIRIDTQTMQSGSYGELLDIWIRASRQAQLHKQIEDAGIPFSAPRMLRLIALYECAITFPTDCDTGKLKGTNFVDNARAIEPGRPTPGWPLASVRSYPHMTVFTFQVDRVGI